MDIESPSTLLGGLSPAQFMRRHWQKKPLLVRQAIPGMQPLISRAALFKLAAQASVESRLIAQSALERTPRKNAVKPNGAWQLQSGPFASRALPPVTQPGWTLLVQGADRHDALVNALLQQFRFVPDARLDDVMISYASPGGGVGPHFDSYDVFLLQASGQRKWRIGRQKDLTLHEGLPLKILQNFEAEKEFVLEAGDMLYLPPRYAHDGVAVPADGGGAGDCMTYSIGFRAPERDALATELLHRLADFGADAAAEDNDPGDDSGHKSGQTARHRDPVLYKDPLQAATACPARLPETLLSFAQKAVAQALKDPLALACALGEHLTEPSGSVWFDQASADDSAIDRGCQLDPRSRMMYDEHHLFINGESHRARGADAKLMRKLADQRSLTAGDIRKASAAALELLEDWAEAGWLHAVPGLIDV